MGIWVDRLCSAGIMEKEFSLLGEPTPLHLAPAPAQCLVFTTAMPALKPVTFRAVLKLAGKEYNDN